MRTAFASLARKNVNAFLPQSWMTRLRLPIVVPTRAWMASTAQISVSATAMTVLSSPALPTSRSASRAAWMPTASPGHSDPW